jgi:predicted ATPase
MNYYLFIDNFRGFKNTYIPIRDVNFLVGENSTGKSSVLGLFKLFAGAQYLLQSIPSEFGDKHVKFGNFSDMVSRHSDDRSHFDIGIVRQQQQANGKDKSAVTVAILYGFTEDDGRARLASFTILRESQRLSLRFVEDKAWFREVSEAGQPSPDDIKKLMPQWQKENCGRLDGWKPLDIPGRGMLGRLPLMMLMNFARRHVSGKPTEQAEVEFSYELPFYEEVTWIAPIRTKPQRTYDELGTEFSPEGTHTPYDIRRTLMSKSNAPAFSKFMQRVGKSSGLFQDIKIKAWSGEVTGPFEVDAVLDEQPLNLSTVGYGVSQSLPVLTEVFLGPHGRWFAIQQPEVHLHPRAQAAMGDVFFQMAANAQKRFLIETHSDFTIDRFRMKYRGTKGKKPDSQVLFFERRDKHNTVTALSIDDDGNLPEDQPSSYREFFINEKLDMLNDDESA